MTEKQQQLLFDKGITNVPSDVLCSDNALSESVGMIYDNGEHRVIQRPVGFITTAVGLDGTTAISMANFKLLYVHKFEDQERYIASIPTTVYGTTYDIIIWGTKEESVFKQQGCFVEGVRTLLRYYSASTKITSIGKTLVISDSNGIHYLLWKNNGYEDNGQIPEPDVELYLTTPKSRMGGTRTESSSEPSKITSSNSYEGILSEVQGTITDWRIAEGSSQSVYNDLVVGLYAKNRKVIKQKKCFCEPFFVRTAIELYDGSYTHISQPILLFPAIFTNSYGTLDKLKLTLSITTYACELHYINKSHFEDWSDIVKDVVIFITDGIEIYDTSVDQHPPREFTTNQVVHNGIYRDANTTLSTFHENEVGVSTVTTTKNCWILNQVGDVNNHSITNNHDELINEIESRSIYYKLCVIGRNYEGTDKNVSEKIDMHTLENITTHEQLKYDDYFSRSILLPNFLYSYNSRLNLANVKRNMFEGYGYFMPYDNATYATYTFYVTIKTDNGTKLVRHIEENTYQKQGIWFFYPDSRATHVMILKGQDCILDEDLTEHPSLNGAYYFKGLPTSSEQETPINNAVIPEYTPPTPEYLPNYIVTSDVNNPFVFRAEGYYKVGTGKILGMSSITQALSEGQFGQFPLLAFSESGIWTLSVASTGYYDTIHPMSRDVCNNPNSITQTDGAVFFTSKKGLMVVVGNQVKCVSEQLSGKQDSFSVEQLQSANIGDYGAFFKKCFIAYDYRDSLLWIFNSGAPVCLVYSIKSGTFGKVSLMVLRAVNNYPDCLIQNPTAVYSLQERPDINSDFAQYYGTMITRPLKFENSLALKSIMNVVNIRDMEGDVKLKIFASNNITDWVQLTSLRGAPWLFYRFRYDFTHMRAIDRFSGAVVVTQERRTKKPRTYIGVEIPSPDPTHYTYSIATSHNAITIPQNEQSETILFSTQFYRAPDGGVQAPYTCYGIIWAVHQNDSYTRLYEGYDYELADKRITVTPDIKSIVVAINERSLPTPSNNQAITTITVTKIPDTPTSYTYSVSPSPLRITIPSGASSLEVTLRGYGYRTAGGVTEDFKSYIRIWRRIGSTYTPVGASDVPVYSYGVVDEVYSTDDAVYIAIHDGHIPSSPTDKVASVEIPVTQGQEPSPEPTPTPTPTTGSITLRINNNSGQTVALSGKMILCIKNLATSADAWGSSNQIDIPFEVPTAQGGWPHFWSNPRVIADGQTETIVISTFTQYFGTDIDGQLRTETHNIGEWFGKFFVASDSPQNIAARANHQLGGTPAVMLGVAEKKSTETSVSNSSNLVYASPIAGANNPVEIVDGGEYDINIVDVVTYYLSGADTYDVALVQGGDNLYIRTLRT